MPLQIRLAALVLVTPTAHAQGILGTGKSFTSTPICKKYTCELVKVDKRQGKQEWLWEYSIGGIYSLTLFREPGSESGKISSVFLQFEHGPYYYPLDDKVFQYVQESIVGKAFKALPKECYELSSPKDFYKFKYLGKMQDMSCYNMYAMIEVPGHMISVQIGR